MGQEPKAMVKVKEMVKNEAFGTEKNDRGER